MRTPRDRASSPRSAGAHGASRRREPRQAWSEFARHAAVVATTCVALAGLACVLSVGPVTVRIETGGEPVPDFVLQYTESRGSLHKTVYLNPRVLVVESDKPVVLEKFRPAWGVSGLVVDAVHPDFTYAYTGGGLGRGGPIELPALRPARWRDRLAQGERINFGQVRAHLQRVRSNWLPALGNDGARLEPYLPALSALIAAAYDEPQPLAGAADPGPERSALAAELRAMAGSS